MLETKDGQRSDVFVQPQPARPMQTRGIKRCSPAGGVAVEGRVLLGGTSQMPE